MMRQYFTIGMLCSLLVNAGCRGAQSTTTAPTSDASKIETKSKPKKPKSEGDDEAAELALMKKLKASAENAAAQNDYAGALSTYKRYRTQSGDASVDAEIGKLEARIKAAAEERHTAGVKLYLAEDYEAAVTEFNRALEYNPQHPQAAEYRTRAKQKIEALKKLAPK